MSDKIQDGGPALPTTEANFHNENMRGEGMSLRDYFAAKAMQGLLATGRVEYPGETVGQGISRNAYAMADAMLAARKA